MGAGFGDPGREHVAARGGAPQLHDLDVGAPISVGNGGGSGNRNPSRGEPPSGGIGPTFGQHPVESLVEGRCDHLIRCAPGEVVEVRSAFEGTQHQGWLKGRLEQVGREKASQHRREQLLAQPVEHLDVDPRPVRSVPPPPLIRRQHAGGIGLGAGVFRLGEGSADCGHEERRGLLRAGDRPGRGLERRRIQARCPQRCEKPRVAEHASPNGGIAIGPPRGGLVVPVCNHPRLGVHHVGHLIGRHEPAPRRRGAQWHGKARVPAVGAERDVPTVVVADVPGRGRVEQIERQRDSPGQLSDVGRLARRVQIEEGAKPIEFVAVERGLARVDGLLGLQNHGTDLGSPLHNGLIWSAFDLKGLTHNGQGERGPIDGVAVSPGWGGGVDVLDVRDATGQTPRQMGRVADDHPGDARDVHPHRTKSRSLDRHLVHDRGRAEAHLRATEQEGDPKRGSRGAYHDCVRAGLVRHVEALGDDLGCLV